MANFVLVTFLTKPRLKFATLNITRYLIINLTSLVSRVYIDDAIAELKVTFIPNTICRSVEFESGLASSRYYNRQGLTGCHRYFSVNTWKLTGGLLFRVARYRQNLYRRWRFIGHGPKIDSKAGRVIESQSSVSFGATRLQFALRPLTSPV